RHYTMTLLLLHVILVAAAVITIQATHNTSAMAIPGETYPRCQRGSIYVGQELDVVFARSTIECASKCSVTAGCEGLNVCPGSGGQVKCTLLSERNHEGCSSLTASSSLCFFMQKKQSTHVPVTTPDPSVTTEPLSTADDDPCQNGGTKLAEITDGKVCDCPPQYGGPVCDRYIRDCKEAYSYGGSVDGVYTIQPEPAPEGFTVYCLGPETFFFKRTTHNVFNMSWDQAKLGFGQMTSADFFLALDNLHYLTSQATYNMVIHLVDAVHSQSHTATFNNFKMSDEDSLYTATYEGTSGQGGGFPNSPITFCNWDRDCHGGCAKAKDGLPGWFDGSCDGFVAYGRVLEWVVNGKTAPLEKIEIAVDRVSPDAFS
ncbi:hypothetical protein BaRGS_00014604, partial [Batillaria attramentaria]